MWYVPLGQDVRVHVKVDGNQSNECLKVSDFVRHKRNIDMSFATLGLLFSTLHLALLVYIRFMLKRRGFILLILQVRRRSECDDLLAFWTIRPTVVILSYKKLITVAIIAVTTPTIPVLVA